MTAEPAGGSLSEGVHGERSEGDEPFQGIVPLEGNAERLQRHESSRFRAAAAHARRVYPGPLGELVARELSAYAEFGFRLNVDALIPQLATQVLATPALAPARADAA